MNRPLTIRQGDDEHAWLLTRVYGRARLRLRWRTGYSLTSDATHVHPMTRAARRLAEIRREERLFR